MIHFSWLAFFVTLAVMVAGKIGSIMYGIYRFQKTIQPGIICKMRIHGKWRYVTTGKVHGDLVRISLHPDREWAKRTELWPLQPGDSLYVKKQPTTPKR